MTLTLVLGGARSGKSAYALAQAEATSMGPLILIATAQAFDAEMTERIALHQRERGPRWRTVEAPLNLAEAIASLQDGDVAVVDCLTLWLTNVMLGDYPILPAVDLLLTALDSTTAEIFLVSNELGQGVVPDNALARRFRDEAGRLNQRVAAQADRVTMVIAGLPLFLKS